MLSREFYSFCTHWLAKADEYHDDELRSAFDRFFTLFVIYNRLYGEVTFHLAREGGVKLSRRERFPDAKAATDYVIQFLGASDVIELLEADAACMNAIGDIEALLDRAAPSGRQFAVKLDMMHGTPVREADLELLSKLRSANQNYKAKAILEFIYAIRCNLFHGHKGFEPVQIEVMRPANTPLQRIIEILFERLNAIESRSEFDNLSGDTRGRRKVPSSQTR